MTQSIDVCVHICQCAICQSGGDYATLQQHQRINLFLSRLTEPQRRWYAGMLSQQPDGPSDVELARITGLDRKTIRRGRREVIAGLTDPPPGRQRRVGGGRLRAEKKILSS
jgi:hypothetical protein